MSEFFSSFGDVVDVFIPVNNYGDSRGFAFVSVKEENVDIMLEKANGADFMGRNLVVNLPLPPGEKPVKKGT
jgi:RNA recognition motif-containing protein